MLAAGGAVEARVAEREDAAVGRDEPIPVSGRRRGHADDRPVEALAAGGAVEARVAEREDAAVRCDQPVPTAAARRRHPDDRAVEVPTAGGAVEVRVAEREDAAVGGDEPVALRGRRRRHVHDRMVEGQASRRPEVRRRGRGLRDHCALHDRDHAREAGRGDRDRDERRDPAYQRTCGIPAWREHSVASGPIGFPIPRGTQLRQYEGKDRSAQSRDWLIPEHAWRRAL